VEPKQNKSVELAAFSCDLARSKSALQISQKPGRRSIDTVEQNVPSVATASPSAIGSPVIRNAARSNGGAISSPSRANTT